MKALILAAGLGSRLAPLTYDVPKALVSVCGVPIVIKQIENLIENHISAKDITIVSGYKAEILETTINNAYPEVRFIRNTQYETTNNMYSAYLARGVMENECFLMMNADVFFDSSVIEGLLGFSAGNAIVTDVGRYFVESMKVVAKDERLIEISKDVSQQDALGASIDVYKFSVEAATAFFKKCQEYIEEQNEKKKWSEVALNDILSTVVFAACPLNGRWYEIDNWDDLRAAEQIFSKE